MCCLRETCGTRFDFQQRYKINVHVLHSQCLQLGRPGSPRKCKQMIKKFLFFKSALLITSRYLQFTRMFPRVCTDMYSCVGCLQKRVIRSYTVYLGVVSIFEQSFPAFRSSEQTKRNKTLIMRVQWAAGCAIAQQFAKSDDNYTLSSLSAQLLRDKDIFLFEAVYVIIG